MSNGKAALARQAPVQCLSAENGNTALPTETARAINAINRFHIPADEGSLTAVAENA